MRNLLHFVLRVHKLLQPSVKIFKTKRSDREMLITTPRPSQLAL